MAACAKQDGNEYSFAFAISLVAARASNIVTQLQGAAQGLCACYLTLSLDCTVVLTRISSFFGSRLVATQNM